MAKVKIKFVVKPKAPRDPYALHAKQRRASKFKDRRAARGGAKDKQREYREDT